MAVLVTGGAGFVGVSLVEALLDAAHEVVLVDTVDVPAGADRSLRQRRGALKIEKVSVLDRESLATIFGRYAIERVVHAAAITSGASREARDPARIVDVNLQGTLNVLEAAREHDVRRIVYVGSGAAYGESLYRFPVVYEETPSVPTSLYSITKHAAERTCMRLADLWSVDAVCVRLGTVIGPWERDTGARDNFGTHSQLARLAVRGEAAILTAREVQRDWVYAKDVAYALSELAFATRLQHRLYNVSSGAAWQQPIAGWCAALKSSYPAFRYATEDAQRKANIWYTDRDRGCMDIGRLMRDTGFRPRHLMAEAYSDYLAWMKRTPEFFEQMSGGERSA
jgi:nucleoside-diphosphate-sugar epimerase